MLMREETETTYVESVVCVFGIRDVNSNDENWTELCTGKSVAILNDSFKQKDVHKWS